MNAPLSPVTITSFAADLAPARDCRRAGDRARRQAPVLPPIESDLDIAVREARLEVETRRNDEIAALVEAHYTAMAGGARRGADGVGSRRRPRSRRAGSTWRCSDLKDALANRLVAVLRPLLSPKRWSRGQWRPSRATIDRILADPDHPCLTIRGPADLLAAISAGRASDDGLIYETSDDTDVVVTADRNLRIETRLGRMRSSRSLARKVLTPMSRPSAHHEIVIIKRHRGEHDEHHGGRLEDRLRRLHDGDDGVLPRHVADQRQRQDARLRCALFQSGPARGMRQRSRADCTIRRRTSLASPRPRTPRNQIPRTPPSPDRNRSRPRRTGKRKARRAGTIGSM